MRRLGRAAVSIVGLVVLVAGVPTVLITVVGWPLPHGLPSVDEIRSGLGDGWRPNERFVLGVLGLVAWALWAQLLRHVVAAIRLRRYSATQAPQPSSGQGGLSQRLAGWLVGGLALAGPVSAAAATAAPALPAVLTSARALAAPETPAPTPPPVSERSTPASSPSYVVHTWDERRDCLWNIAGRYLRDPFRWVELLELNAEVVQPSGRRLAEDAQHWVYPGMVLRLPADATGPEVIPSAPAVGPSVAPGAPTANGSQPARSEMLTPSLPPATEADTAAESSPPGGVSDRAPAPRSERTSPAPSARSAGDQRDEAPVIRLGRNAMLVAQALALGLPVFAAGGLVRHLNRRRRVQVARRRPGRDIVRPDPASETLELRARAIAVDEAAEWVDAALRILGARLREASMPAPSITCVRAGELGLEILVDQASTPAPPGFVAVDGGYVWRLDPDTELKDLRTEAEKYTAAAPALVSIGASPEGPLLVDLEALGALSVEGAPDRVSSFLAGVAMELASAPWAEGVDVRLVGPEPGLANVGGVEVVDDAGVLVDELASMVTTTAAALGEGRTTLAGRLAEPAEAWFPTVVVVGGSRPPAEMARLAKPCGAGSGVALVGPGPFPGATWRLVIVEDGHARLEPLGLVVRAAAAPTVLESEIGALDHAAIADAAGLLSAASRDDDVEAVAQIRAVTPEVSAVDRRQYAVRVNVLGPVEVSGWAKPVGLRRKYEEIVAYLATHEGRVGGERLRLALWPDKELDPKSFREAMSRVRGHLGRDAGHLPAAVGGAYFLGENVECDWTLFKQLSTAAASAARSDPAKAMALWREALELVRGEPFGGGLHEQGAYGWAYSELLVYDMQREITEAADALAELALAIDDPDTTLWATRQGHVASPNQLTLFDWEMRVARHRLDLDGLKHAYRSRRLAEQTLDPTADVLPETAQLYEQLLSEINVAASAAAPRNIRVANELYRSSPS